jgi:hypothetical protein
MYTDSCDVRGTRWSRTEVELVCDMSMTSADENLDLRGVFRVHLRSGQPLPRLHMNVSYLQYKPYLSKPASASR